MPAQNDAHTNEPIENEITAAMKNDEYFKLRQAMLHRKNIQHREKSVPIIVPVINWADNIIKAGAIK